MAKRNDASQDAGSPWLVPLTVVVVGVLVAGLVIFEGDDEPPPGPSTSSAADARLAADVDRLVAENAALAGRVTDLELRLASLERGRPVSTGEAEPIPTPRELVLEEALEEMADYLADADATAQAEAPEFLRGMVEQALDRREQIEAEERDARRRAANEREVADRVTRLRDELGLDDYQASEMHDILLTQETAEDTLRDSMREQGYFDRRAMRDGMIDIHDAASQKLETVLYPHQYEQYQELVDGWRGGWGRGGWGGGPPRGGDDRGADDSGGGGGGA